MYFVYPFAVAGTVGAIPPTASPDVLSYQYGFGVDFELPLNTNPSALPIPRGQFNQLMNDITSTLQTLYQYGTPPFILASQNLGVAFPYPIYARVYYSGQVWENQVAANTTTPGTDESWFQVSASFDSIQSGMIIDYAGTTIFNGSNGYLSCNGQSVTRATFPDLFSAITFVQTGTTDGTDGVITGLSNMITLAYPGMVVEGTGIVDGSVIVTVNSNTSITINNNTTGAGTPSITFFPFGRASSTAFNVPDLRRSVSMGSGGTGTAVIGSVVGQHGGEEAHVQTLAEMHAHNHSDVSSPSWDMNFVTAAGGGSNQVPCYNAGTPAPAIPVTIPTDGSNSAANVIQPSVIMQKIIKT
jgi:microcystin-dependent protein